MALQPVYGNNLKNWEFSQEAPQNSHLGRTNSVEGQGASEDENFEEKPTQPKPNSSSGFGINYFAHINLFDRIRILTNTASYLCHEELTSSFALVCKDFKGTACADVLWKVFLKSTEVIPEQAKAQAKTFLKKYCTHFNAKLKSAPEFFSSVKNFRAPYIRSKTDETLRWKTIQEEWLKKDTASLSLYQLKAAIDVHIDEKLLLYSF